MLDTALKKCSQNYRELTMIIHKQEEQLRFLETKATYLSMFYFASQLLICLSNKNPSAYRCRNWWKLFFVSVSLAVVFGLNFTTTIGKYLRIKYEQDRNYIDQSENYVQMANLANYAEEAAKGGSSKETAIKVSNEPDMFAVYLRYAHIGITVFALTAFTVLVLHTCTLCGQTL